MILLLGCWAVLLCAARVAGAAIFTLTDGAPKLFRTQDRMLAQTWMGLFAISSVLLSLSTAIPISLWAGGLVLAAFAAMAAFPAVRAELRCGTLSPIHWAGLSMALLVSSWNATGTVILYDTGLYHYPLIRWLHEAGSAPGLTLLHYRFTFSSSTFALLAALDAGWIQGHATTVLNGLAFALILFHFAIVSTRILIGAAESADVFVCGAWVVVLYTALAQRLQVSPSPNLPAAIGIVITCWIALSVRDGALPVLLAAASLSVRVLAIPLLAIVALTRLRSQRSHVLAGLLAIALGGSILLANVTSSGCPAFPSRVLCIQLPWTATPPELARAAAETTNWSRYMGPYPEDAAFFQKDWFPKWIQNRFNVVFLTILVLAPAIVLAFRAWSWVFAAGLIGAIWVFVEAPDLRYGCGYLAVLFGAAVEAVHRRVKLRWLPDVRSDRLFLALSAVAVLLILGDSRIREDAKERWNASRLLLPPKIQSGPAQWEYTTGGHGIIYIHPVRDERCWGLSLMCSPHEIPVDTGFCKPDRGPAGGFCRAR